MKKLLLMVVRLYLPPSVILMGKEMRVFKMIG